MKTAEEKFEEFIKNKDWQNRNTVTQEIIDCMKAAYNMALEDCAVSTEPLQTVSSVHAGDTYIGKQSILSLKI